MLERTLDLVLVDAALLGYVHLVLVLDTVAVVRCPRNARTKAKIMPMIIILAVSDMLTKAPSLDAAQSTTQLFVGLVNGIYIEV